MPAAVADKGSAVAIERVADLVNVRAEVDLEDFRSEHLGVIGYVSGRFNAFEEQRPAQAIQAFVLVT